MRDTALKKLARLAYLEAAPLAVALAVAERFFHFGSFTLEAIPFLGLWWATSAAYSAALDRLHRWWRLVPAPASLRA